MNVAPRRPFAPGEPDLVVERPDREQNESFAAMLENLWVAAGVAGWVAAGGVVFGLWRYWPLPWGVVVLGLCIVAFLAVAGVYAILWFGLDDWQNPLRIMELEGMVVERDRTIRRQAADMDLLNVSLAAAQAQVGTLERRLANTTDGDTPKPRMSRRLQCAAIIATKWAHGVDYTRDALVDGERLMSKNEWTCAMSDIDEVGFVDREERQRTRKQVIRATTLRREQIIDAVRAKLQE